MSDLSERSAPPLPFDGRIVELDVRDDLRNGREPFQRIIAAVDGLAPTDVLHLRATFQPVPLLRVLARRGFAHVAREEGAEEWSVWFHRPATEAGAVGASSGGAVDQPAPSRPAAAAEPHELVLDVRGLEPPEPMVRTLAALETLPAGRVLVQHNARVPQFLLPILDERGFTYEVDVSVPDDVVVRIRRGG